MPRATAKLLALRPIRPAPAAIGDSAIVTEGESVVIDALANDEGSNLELLSVGTPGVGSAVLGAGGNAGKIVYTAPVGFVGSVIFPYTIRNTVTGKTASATVAVAVTADEMPVETIDELPAPTSTVTVSGANANARFSDLQSKVNAVASGQHIVVPNFVIGDGSQTLTLKAGIPYIIRAEHPVNPQSFNLDGSDSAFCKFKIRTPAGGTGLGAVWITGLNIDGTGWHKSNGLNVIGLVQMRGLGWRVWRNRIYGWKGTCIVLGQSENAGGSDWQIGWNWMSVKSWIDEPGFPLSASIPERARSGIRVSAKSEGDAEKNGVVHHNYFIGFAPRGKTYAEWGNSVFTVGLDAAQTNWNWNVAVRENLFEFNGIYSGPASDTASAPLFETKGGGVTFMLNTVRDSGRSMHVSNRHGGGETGEITDPGINQWISNLFRRHHIFRYFDGAGKMLGNEFYEMQVGIEVMAGNENYTSTKSNRYCAAHNVRFSGNKVFGPGKGLHIGHAFSGANSVKIDGVTIDGLVITQNPGESYDQARERLYGKILITSGNIASGQSPSSPYPSTAADTWPPCRELFYPADVGPTAGLTAPSLSVANYQGQWTAFIKAGSGASITQVGTTLRLTAGTPASATVRDATKDALIVSKAPALAGNGSLEFEIRSINIHAGAGVNPSGLVTIAYNGDGSAGHPADPNAWTTEAGVNGYAFFGLGTRVTLDPTGDAGNEGEIRARYHNANGANAGPNIIDSSDYAGQSVPRRFKFTLNTWYRVKITRSGDNLTVQQWSLATGSPVEVTPSVTGTHANISDLAGGYVIFGVMQGRAFEIRSVVVT